MNAKDELFALLANEPAASIVALKVRLLNGQIDGGWYWYEDRNCGCIYGTLAWLRGADDIQKIKNQVAVIAGAIGVRTVISGKPKDYPSEIERFAEIHKGDTPENNERSAQLVSWIDEYLETRHV